MKKYLYLVFAVMAMSCVFYSCSQDFTEESLSENSPQKMTKEELKDLLLTDNLINNIKTQLHSSVQNSIIRGYDEKVCLKALLTTDKYNSLYKDNISMALRHSPKHKVTVNTQSKVNPIDVIIGDIEDSGLSVYWPYSDNWDGKEDLTIVVAPEDETVTECIGYYTDANNKVSSKIVDEKYAIEHPVIIINNKKEDDVPELYASSQYYNYDYEVNTWQLVSMKVERQYDSWIAGGSEIDIHIVTPTATGYATGTTRIRINFTRKEIGDNIWKDISLPLNTNWRPEQITNYIAITESDGGGKISIPVSVEYKNKDKNETTIKISTTIEIQKNDERIGEMQVDRDYMLRNSLLYFDNKNVTLNCPIIHE